MVLILGGKTEKTLNFLSVYLSVLTVLGLKTVPYSDLQKSFQRSLKNRPRVQ